VERTETDPLNLGNRHPPKTKGFDPKKKMRGEGKKAGVKEASRGSVSA